MAQTKLKEDDAENPSGFLAILAPRLRESLIIGQLLLAVLFAVALYSFDPNDPGWTYTGLDAEVSNLVGSSGAWVADVLLVLFGLTALSFPFLLLIPVVKRLVNRGDEPWVFALLLVQGFGLLLTIAACAVLSDLHFYGFGGSLREGSGSDIGSPALMASFTLRLKPPTFRTPIAAINR